MEDVAQWAELEALVLGKVEARGSGVHCRPQLYNHGGAEGSLGYLRPRV